jgi:hypothetical protein
MTWMFRAVACGLLLVVPACADGSRRPPDASVPCSLADAYDTLSIFDFEGSSSGWFAYTDHTPGGVPDLTGGANVPVSTLDPPRCGSSGAIELVAYGNNYWGAGFGDWEHNTKASRADGTGYDGISFWARSASNSDKTFLLKVDDGRTFVAVSAAPDGGAWPAATSGDQDLDGDGLLGPGDIASGTACLLPPPQSIGDPSCYYGGTQAPTAVTRVPEPGECGNPFHTYVTITEDWQLYLVPWNQLVQWPCPNRLAGGIDPADIRKIEVRLVQGTHYDIWLDDINFYRPRVQADAGR